MYHTKCTCLVNGRQPGHFLQEDLPNILKTVELNLQQNSVTVDEILFHQLQPRDSMAPITRGMPNGWLPSPEGCRMIKI